MNNDMTAIRDKIMLATLDQVPFDGVSNRSLKDGVSSAGYKPSMSLRAFPGGVRDLVEHFSDWSNRQMLIEAEKLDLSKTGIREKIHAHIKARFKIYTPHKEAVRRLSSWLVLPQNAGLATNLTWNVSSTIWYAVGDTSSDWNYYSKRALLAAALSATLLYWLSDEGNEESDYPETWAFLDRRLNGIVQTFGAGKKLGDLLGGALNGARECYGRMGGIGRRT